MLNYKKISKIDVAMAYYCILLRISIKMFEYVNI